MSYVKGKRMKEVARHKENHMQRQRMMSRYPRYKNDQRTKQEVVKMMNGMELMGKLENNKKISRNINAT